MERCLICHRPLKDEISIKRKIGPKCYERMQLVTKQQKAKRKARTAALKLKDRQLKGQINMFEEDKNGYRKTKNNS